MSFETWKIVTSVSAVQVLSECVFFAQGILASEETNREETELDWIRICVPLFYAVTRHISEPCWRWIIGGYGGRITTILGIATVAVSVIAASCQEILAGNVAYVVLGGIGMGLVRLQVKLMKFHSANWKLWGTGVSGIGLSLWPLIACLFIRRIGPKYALLVLSGITLHAIPLALLVKPNAITACEEDEPQNPDDGIATVSITPAVSETLPSLEQYRMAYQLIEYDSYAVRPSYYVEVLPGIPEESEYESEREQDEENQTVVVPDAEESGVRLNGGSRQEEKHRRESHLQEKTRDTNLKGIGVLPKGVEMTSFTYSLFIANVLLRLGDQFGVAIVISILPVFASHLLPDLRVEEKAFLMSLCGFSRILTELPLVALVRKSGKSKLVFLGGPFFASVGLYLTWISRSLDAMTLASLGLGIGSGAASAALQFLAPRECPRISDATDIVVGVALLVTIPLTRIFILGDAIQACFLLAAWIYAAAAIIIGYNFRTRT
ncbi:uncharacterized protein LOC124412405 isoform X2 [Diprion similis]|uniref:uncharacterized protein LOC124412405 isoform X2 n=1 Tax=Diprion similis TaxID=362088 RepID=UPI001EF92348|nr:uncharacterized protein LOC124412405 isoform X2 [Diprion similis]